MKILFCKITWMENYIGREYEMNTMPHTGGKFVDEYREGGEEYNYLDIDGNCYGFVETKSNKNGANKLHVEKLDGISKNATKAENVLVVWVAKNEKGKPKVVGWYNNATVYSQYQSKPFRDYGFNVKAKSEDCILLPLNKRIIEVPSAGKDGVPKGSGFGQANVWYALEKEAIPLVEKITDFIYEYDGERINKVYTELELNSLSEMKFNEIDEYYEKASEYINREKKEFITYNDYLNALKMHNSIIELNDKAENALFNRGYCLMELLRYGKAINAFDEYIRLYPNDYLAYYNLGILYYITEKMDKCIEYFHKASKINSDDVDIYFRLGNAFYYKNEYSEALNNYKICVEKDNGYIGAYYSIANIEYNINKNAENAIKYYDKALEINNEDFEALYQKAFIFKEEGKINEAIKVIDQALKMDKNNSWFIDLKYQITHKK